MSIVKITTPTELESKARQYHVSHSGCTREYKRTEDIVKANVWIADFETSSLPNYETFGRVHVWLWSLVNSESREVYFGWGVKDFLAMVKKVKAKIVYFP